MSEHERRMTHADGEVAAIKPDEDFCGWLLQHASHLRSCNLAALDSLNLAEELEAMAGSERRKVVSLLRLILGQLLKWHHSRTRRSENSWQVSLAAARTDVKDVLEASRSLRNELPELMAKAYKGARLMAGTEMRLAKHNWQHLFPDTCPWTESQAVDEDF